MIVLDASALVELVLSTERGALIARRISNPAESLHAPHLADIEVAHALRRYVREGDLDANAAAGALGDLRDLDLERHPHEPWLDRIWELRENLTPYDAVYVALAEVLGAPLITCDGKLSRTSGVDAAIELVS